MQQPFEKSGLGAQSRDRPGPRAMPAGAREHRRGPARSRGVNGGGVRAAAMYTLIGTAKLNDVDPQAWLADALGRIAGTPHSRLHELLPWHWVSEQRLGQAA